MTCAKIAAEVDAVPIGRAADEPEFQEPKLFNGDQLYPGKLVFAVNPVCYVLRAGDKYLAIGRIAATKSWQVCSTFAGTSAGLDRVREIRAQVGGVEQAR